MWEPGDSHDNIVGRKKRGVGDGGLLYGYALHLLWQAPESHALVFLVIAQQLIVSKVYMMMKTIF